MKINRMKSSKFKTWALLPILLSSLACASVNPFSPIPSLEKRIEVRKNSTDKVTFNNYILRTENSAEVDYIKNMLENIPDVYQEILNKKGLKIVICDNIKETSEYQEYEKKFKKSHGFSSYLSRLASENGCFADEIKTVFIDKKSVWKYPQAGLHEVGHALDDYLGNISSESFSKLVGKEHSKKEYFAISMSHYYLDDASRKSLPPEVRDYFKNLEKGLLSD